MDDPSGQCIKFIKSYIAHTAPIRALVMYQQGGYFSASIGKDNVIKFYYVYCPDVMGMIQVTQDYPCGRAAALLGEKQSLLEVFLRNKRNNKMLS